MIIIIIVIIIVSIIIIIIIIAYSEGIIMKIITITWINVKILIITNKKRKVFFSTFLLWQWIGIRHRLVSIISLNVWVWVPTGMAGVLEIAGESRGGSPVG